MVILILNFTLLFTHIQDKLFKIQKINEQQYRVIACQFLTYKIFQESKSCNTIIFNNKYQPPPFYIKYATSLKQAYSLVYFYFYQQQKVNNSPFNNILMKPAVTNVQGPILTTEQLLKQVDLQVYAQPFKAFGIDKSEDLFALKAQDWQKLKVKPLHKTKLIDAATQHRLQISRGCELHQYIFSSSGPYNATHKPESMLNFDPQGYGVSNTNNCFMVFGFNKPVNCMELLLAIMRVYLGVGAVGILKACRFRCKCKDRKIGLLRILLRVCLMVSTQLIQRKLISLMLHRLDFGKIAILALHMFILYDFCIACVVILYHRILILKTLIRINLDQIVFLVYYSKQSQNTFYRSKDIKQLFMKATSKLAISITSIDELLKQAGLQVYTQAFKAYGIELSEDVFLLMPQDWDRLKIKPFHRTKIVHTAVQRKQEIMPATTVSQVNHVNCNTNGNGNDLHEYQFSSNGPYNGNHKPQNLLNFDAQGYGLTNSTDCHMTFTFAKPLKVYGVIIGNNVGVSGGWGSSYLQGVQIQVQLQGSEQWTAVHTIAGMPNTANTAYLAKINQCNVLKVKFWKNGYFSTSFVHFV